MSKKLFIAGIGTNVGKTVVSAILRKATNAAYWKLVQAGDLAFSDTMKVKDLSQCDAPIFEERYRLNTAASPHLAAKIDGVEILKEDLIFPETNENLLIEGAGGLMVPLNETGLLNIDIIEHWKIPVVLVSRHYLGSINHTLMSLEILKQHQIEVKALIFVGDENLATESIILQRFPIKLVHRIPESDSLDANFVRIQAEKIPFDVFF